MGCERYDLAQLARSLADASLAQGMLLGRLADLGPGLRAEATLVALTEEVVQSSRIEGEHLAPESVRSSIARRLGIDIGGLAPTDRNVEGVVEMALDAAQNHDEPLTAERLLRWHAALFPTGQSGLVRIRVGEWRDDAHGPMQVVSGPVSRQKVHYEAPPAARLRLEIAQLLAWVEASTNEHALIKAAIAHLWFVTLHPFEDGNGRIARAVGDLMLARADRSPLRFYSMSAQIQRERNDYYDILERTQKDGMDVTAWLTWFLATLRRAVVNAQTTLDAVLAKSRFWQRWAGTPLNPRHSKIINRLLDGFEGKLTTSRWASMAHCSSDTALRDITELLELGILQRSPGAGRGTGYELVLEEPAAPHQERAPSLGNK